MSDIERIIDKLKEEAGNIEVPRFLLELKGEFMDAVDTAASETFNEISSTFNWKAFKRRIRIDMGARIRNIWESLPWYFQIVRAFVMPPIMRTIRGIMKKY